MEQAAEWRQSNALGRLWLQSVNKESDSNGSDRKTF
jgi:hypothetical protein